MAKTGVWEFAQDLIVALVGQDFMVTVSLLGAIALWFIWKKGKWPTVRKILLTIFVCLIAVPLAYYAWLFRAEPPRYTTEKTEDQIVKAKPSETPTAIYMECNMASLPITIPARTAIHLIPLNKKRMQSVKWGFYDVPNDSSLERQWPDKAVMDKATKSFNPGLFIWRCQVSNHGTLNVLDIGMPSKIWFGNEKPEVTYDAIITPLDAGAKFDFYPVNDCPGTVSAVWPDTVKLQVLGEPHRREVPLRRTFKSPIDQIMVFVGSTTRFIGGEPCE